MAEYDNQVRSYNAAATTVVDEGLRAYMLRVYNYMLLGLALTGATAWLAAETPLRQVFFNFTPVGVSLNALGWVALLAPIGLVFWLYAGLMGIGLAPVLLLYTGASVAQVFFITAATFGAMSLWGYTTKRDLTGFGSFLMMGLIGIIIASLVGMFWHNSALQWMISIIGVIVFTGLTAYDTQSIKESYYVGDDGTIAGKKAIMGALRLYLDFINLFIMLLRLLGDRR